MGSGQEEALVLRSEDVLPEVGGRWDGRGTRSRSFPSLPSLAHSHIHLPSCPSKSSAWAQFGFADNCGNMPSVNH